MIKPPPGGPVSDNGLATHVDALQASRLLAPGSAPLLVLDVRTAEEYARAHVAGSVLIDAADPLFAIKAGELPKDRPLFVLCRCGRRSRRALPLLRRLGFGPIFHLERGLKDYLESGFVLPG